MKLHVDDDGGTILKKKKHFIALNTLFIPLNFASDRLFSSSSSTDLLLLLHTLSDYWFL